MKTLDDKILHFDNWSQPWTFYKFISNDKTLSASDLKLFVEIWEKAEDLTFWNNADLILCCKASHTFIKENYDISDEAIANIVRAISYQWK